MAKVVQLVRDLGESRWRAEASRAQYMLRRGRPLRWPLYATTLRLRHNCPVTVLVVTPYQTVAAWARRPILLGPGNTYQVAVLGPDAIPRIDSPDVSPELALLSVKAHAETDAATGVLWAAVRCVMALAPDAQTEYHDRLMAWLTPALKEKVKAMLKEHFPYPQSDFAKEHYGKGLLEGEARGEARGEAKGKRAVLLRLLNSRFGELPSEIEDRVGKAESETLLRWSDRVLDATSLAAIFADD